MGRESTRAQHRLICCSETGGPQTSMVEEVQFLLLANQGSENFGMGEDLVNVCTVTAFDTDSS
eukprot:scaffold1904_cov280-Chaetoceros_neogracile.AAC.17